MRVLRGGFILVVDDDQFCRTLLSSTFRQEGYSTEEAASAEEAFAAVESAMGERQLLAVLLEVNLPGMSGYEVFRRLREKYGEDLPVVFISGTRTEVSDRVAGLHLGADDYIVKPFAIEEVIARVLRLLRRARHHEKESEVFELLTPREVEVLLLLANGFTSRAIAERLFISRATAATHVQRILSKLGVHSRTEAASLAHRHGLVSTDLSASS